MSALAAPAKLQPVRLCIIWRPQCNRQAEKHRAKAKFLETPYGERQTTFGVPLGWFELSDITILNAN